MSNEYTIDIDTLVRTDIVDEQERIDYFKGLIGPENYVEGMTVDDVKEVVRLQFEASRTAFLNNL